MSALIATVRVAAGVESTLTDDDGAALTDDDGELLVERAATFGRATVRVASPALASVRAAVPALASVRVDSIEGG
jgi:hypothetical protein